MISPARGRVIGFIQYPRPQAAPERGPALFERLGVEHAATLRNSTGAEQCSRTRSLSGMDAPAVLVCFRWLFRPELTLLLLDASDPPLRRALHITYAKNRPASPLDFAMPTASGRVSLSSKRPCGTLDPGVPGPTR